VPSEPSLNALQDLRLSDLLTFLILARTGSVTAAAREMKVTPSQASKALGRLEQHYRVKLLLRSPKGMTLSDEGRQVLPHIRDAVQALAATARVGDQPDTALELTIAAPSYLLGFVIAAIAASQPTLRLRGIELGPSQIRATLTEGQFDVAVLPGGVKGLPPSWVQDEVGVLRKVLIGPPELVTGRLPLSVDDVRALPFVGTLSSTGGRFTPLTDDCPLPVAERRIVHRVQTFGASLELALRARCVTFGPWLGARRLLRSGELIELPVIGWNETERLELLYDGDVVRERVRQQLLTTLRHELSAPAAA
jgi:DNA-binding transcriptional LysR family regulator